MASGPFPDSWQILLEPTDTGPRPCTDLTNMGSGIGPGDLRPALCWEINFNRGESWQLALSTSVLPEPDQVLMLAAGLSFVAIVGRRRIRG